MEKGRGVLAWQVHVGGRSEALRSPTSLIQISTCNWKKQL